MRGAHHKYGIQQRGLCKGLPQRYYRRQYILATEVTETDRGMHIRNIKTHITHHYIKRAPEQKKMPHITPPQHTEKEQWPMA